MKNIIVVFLIILMTFSCNVTPLWTNIGSNGVFIENCNDTILYNQFDSVCDYHNISTPVTDWSKMTYYNDKEDLMIQWTYNTKNADTIYTITYIDNLYIFTIKTLQNNIE